MKRITTPLFAISLVASFVACSVASVVAQIRLPRLISDGMVLQRDVNIPVWGWAAPNEKITIEFNGKVVQATADGDGKWTAKLLPMKAGGPFKMILTASNTITINDILVGDVWLCSGQSNMELNMKRASPLYEKEIAEANNSAIRYFAVPQKYNFVKEESDLGGGVWKQSSPSNVLSFSAVSYFFARELNAKYKVPIGIINASLGGSPIEAWISEEACKEFPVHYNELQRFKDSTLIEQTESNDNARTSKWYNELYAKDEGRKRGEMPWYSKEYDISTWQTIKIPSFWTNKLGKINGVVWFKRNFEVPASWIGKSVKLNLGRIVDADSVFVNGIFVGTTSYQYPPRRYEIPAGVLKDGRNNITIRVISNSGEGGFIEDKPYELKCDGQVIDLTGEWRCKVGTIMEPLAGTTAVRFKPVGLYNAMLAPISQYSIKGAVWYQGESNTDRAEEYRSLLPTLINTWRKKWNVGEFPFIVIQLSNFGYPLSEPADSNWAMLREAQQSALSLPKTQVVVTIDVGEWNDIHPLNKKTVGVRASLAAQRIAYNEKVVASGPSYKNMKIDGDKIILSFDEVGGGLTFKGAEGKGFAIAGSDHQFVWAKAEIRNGRIIVWNDSVKKPKVVRYAWANNPVDANLYNKEGLPAFPFRTK